MTPAIKKIIKPALFLLFLVTDYSLLAPKTFAQTAMGISAIPPRLEMNVKPDEVVSQVVKVRNESNSEQLITTSVSDFIVTNDQGTPVQVKTNPEDNRWASSSWIQVSPDSLRLKPGETKSLVLTVMPPKDALPGGHYAMVLHNPQNLSSLSSTGFSVQTQVGTLIYINIPGKVKMDAAVKSFTAPKFSEYGPIDFKATIKNMSDIHITPAGGITITNMLGGKTASLALEETNIFPYTTRDFENTLNKKWLFGRYTASLTADYKGSNPAVASLVFWVIPWRFLILLVAAVAIIAAIIIINKNKPQDNSPEIDEKVDALEKELEELKNKYKDRK
jgi:hypothetical protein